MAIAEGKDTLVSDIWSDNVVTVHAGRVYAQFQLGGPSELGVFDVDGKGERGPKLAPVSPPPGPFSASSPDSAHASLRTFARARHCQAHPANF